ncbi:hypothetical protein NDU88_004121 [Pleurodeles waltl]|uniref:Uncharacterized protein n=1 Tax=Pleurodeles waltl TaxID=8319 RepID=A0AAV7M942_PLEWA|nr:hypothetical protein NDU88_004121 [Pleurodeles waltl]
MHGRRSGEDAREAESRSCGGCRAVPPEHRGCGGLRRAVDARVRGASLVYWGDLVFSRGPGGWPSLERLQQGQLLWPSCQAAVGPLVRGRVGG